MATMIDTLKFARSFEQAGFATPQAEALTAALAEMNGVTREDLATKADLLQLRNELQMSFADIRNEMRLSFADVRNELQVAAAQLRTENVATASANKWQVLWSLFGSQLFLFVAFVLFNNFSKIFS